MEQFTQFFHNHLVLWIAFIGVLAMVLVNELIMQKQKASELNPQSAVDLINHENAVVIDFRDKELFKSGHIIDAISAKESDFAENKMTKYKERKLILVCKDGLQSGTIAAKLRTQGFQPFVLGGGIGAWKQADLPLVKAK